MVPEGWQQVRLGELFTRRSAKGKQGLPTMSVTLHNGLVPRELLERKTDTNLAAHEHLLIEEGDIAYNMMRMWQGASGLASCAAIVSPAYVVLKPTAAVDPLFASYFFKAPRIIYLFWAYSYGLTGDRLRLYFDDFSRIPVSVPPIEEQRRIGRVMRTWDRAIETVNKLVTNAHHQKKSLMQRLLSGQVSPPGHEQSSWSLVSLASIASLSKERFDPRTSDSEKRCIELEHIQSETGALIGECTSGTQDSVKAMFSPGDVLFGKLRPYLRKFHLPEFEGVCSTEIWVLKAKPRVHATYLYYLVQTDSFHRVANISSGSKMPRADWSVVRDAKFRLPSIGHQEAVVHLLLKADELVYAYQEQKRLLEDQKHALVQKLFTGKSRLVGDTDRSQVATG